MNHGDAAPVVTGDIVHVSFLSHGAQLKKKPSFLFVCALAPFSVRFDAHTFERHQRADVRIFVIGRGWREDSADGIVVVGSDGGTREDVHRGCQCAAAADDDVSNDDTADADGDGDDIVCST